MSSLLLLWILALKSVTQAEDIVGGLAECFADAGIMDSLIGEPSYQNDSMAYNLRLDPHPIGVVFPKSTQDVSKVLKCASAYHLPIG